MTRISRRGIERGLRLPAPAPGAELGRRIKDQIPDDLFAAPDETSRRDRISGRSGATGPGPTRGLSGPVVWAVAASVVVALGAGWLAVRLTPIDTETESLVAASSPRARPERRAALEEESAPLQEPAPPAQQPAVEAPAPAPPDSALAGAAVGAAAAAPAETNRSRGDASGHRERLALAPASAPADRQVVHETDSLDDGLVAAKRSLAKPASDSARLESVVDELLEAAADRAGPRSTSSAIAIEGTAGRAAGRLVLLVSATVLDVRAAGNAEPAADAIELELDPTLVSGYRLLASHARDFGPDAAMPAGAAARASATRRVIALYELEVAGDLDRTTGLGTARLRDDGKAKNAQQSAGLSIVAADFARDWATAAVSVRLATLGAEVALLSADAPPQDVANLRAELERLRAGAEADQVTARRAGQLLDVLSR